MGRAKASEIWKEVKPLIGEMITACNESETRLEKAVEEAYQRGMEDGTDYRTVASVAYQRGLSDMLDAAKVLSVRKNDDEVDALFGYRSTFCIYQDFTPSEIVTKIREHEERRQKEEKLDDSIRHGLIEMAKQCGCEVSDIVRVAEALMKIGG